jgi:hypothetical protein
MKGPVNQFVIPNLALEVVASIAVLAQAGALVWALGRGDLTGVVLINLLGASGFLIATLPTLGVSMKTLDEDFLSLLLALLVFEIVTLATSLMWFFDSHLAWLAWTEFSIQGLLSLAVLIFIFTFRVTRLI